jgi:hypothetical protein
MRLEHAIKRAKALVESGALSPEDTVAIHVLAQMGGRILRVQKPLRQLERALCPEERLSQEKLFED